MQQCGMCHFYTKLKCRLQVGIDKHKARESFVEENVSKRMTLKFSDNVYGTNTGKFDLPT